MPAAPATQPRPKIGIRFIRGGSPSWFISRASIEAIWKLWRKRPGNILVPGHDVPMMLEDGKPKYLDKREAAIRAWYGDDMETTTLFKLTV